MAASGSLPNLSVPCPVCSELITLPIQSSSDGPDGTKALTLNLSISEDALREVIREHLAAAHPEAADA